MKVFNKRKGNIVPPDAVYVGRPTVWGNPFSKGSKTQNIADFRRYAEKRHAKDPSWLAPLKGKDLVCWCAPNGCHGDVILEILENDWDAWAEANAPSDQVLDTPSDWEVQHGLA